MLFPIIGAAFQCIYCDCKLSRLKQTKTQQIGWQENSRTAANVLPTVLVPNHGLSPAPTGIRMDASAPILLQLSFTRTPKPSIVISADDCDANADCERMI